MRFVSLNMKTMHGILNIGERLKEAMVLLQYISISFMDRRPSMWQRTMLYDHLEFSRSKSNDDANEAESKFIEE